ncbi:hypothetical protein AVEN_241586-1 [Araneus ventricosus]|uniref:G-protein coupled receptors family 2 profile 2 domain-containing protein n=1 Tax=Araneus ventricosus TaxID=182803 RepID=A0A4Y2H8B5_ARAVE|nr:hypothetical protein AVEN_241586-1 [Araneus ventricosus]
MPLPRNTRGHREAFSLTLSRKIRQYATVAATGSYKKGTKYSKATKLPGIPVLIVGIVLGVNHKLYSGDEYCWVSGDVLYFAVAFPVSTLLAINFIMFGVIFFSVTCGGSKETLRTNQDQKKDMVARAKAMFCVSLLLGLSWVFGFLAAMEGTKLLFQYLFVITTTLQGFLFFVFFVLRQKNTRELWQNLVKTTSKSGSSQPIDLIELKQF